MAADRDIVVPSIEFNLKANLRASIMRNKTFSKTVKNVSRWSSGAMMNFYLLISSRCEIEV
jgi:hypothetical protein